MSHQNQFMPWSTGSGANVINNTSYAALTERYLGFVDGYAEASHVNTALRQSTSISAMIASFMADFGPSDVVDDGNITNLEDQFKASLSSYLSGAISAGAIHFGTDSGTANHIVVSSVTPAATSLGSWFAVFVKIAHNNTGATDLSLFGTTATAIKRPNGASLQSGDLLEGQVALFVFDGVKWFMASPNAASFSGTGGTGGGVDGINGSQIYSGSGAPPSGTGVNGDFFIRTDTCDFYKKSAGAWAAVVNFKGAAGVDAPTPGTVTLVASTTIASDKFNYLLKLSGSSTFTTTLPTPVGNGGVGRFSVFNASTASQTLTTLTGSFKGQFGSQSGSQTIGAGVTLSIMSDGADWIVISKSSSLYPGLSEIGSVRGATLPLGVDINTTLAGSVIAASHASVSYYSLIHDANPALWPGTWIVIACTWSDGYANSYILQRVA